ncbi:TetR/AcrR family transcriptional regulator [Jiangella anatolica]|uniref:TetR family transcriptional regulator n=1 Tax=Jiangella anatolica TaxID=2670374 RepID=A0A2W2C719_9ACTN|nr:TetR/AcrR family transcriptional regulator [Jiangella anatolica]PZF83917.1 TetR family transcriptional regulator [Jiangella anatolica]
MTDLDPRPGKRERLVAGAADLLHRQGVQRTTLAQIAQHADVPQGNVYYYFKSRDELVDAVIEHRRAMVRAELARLDKRRTPKSRLKGLAETWTQSSDTITSHGCPLGGLSYELNKSHDGLAEHAATVLREILHWAEAQFRELGRRDAAALAVELLSGIQGAVLLANTFGDEALLISQVRRIERWLDSLG